MEVIEFKLDTLLKSKNYPKYRFARNTGLDYRTILNYCKGNIKRIHTEHLIAFCKELKCNVEDVMQYKEK